MFSPTSVTGVLARRAVDGTSLGWKPPPLAYIFLLGDFILFLPVLLVIGYSLACIFPTLAAVEDPLSEYEALAMNDDEDGTPKDPVGRSRTARPGKPITSSLRAISRLLRSQGGWLSFFRGFGVNLIVGIMTITTTTFFTIAPFIPMFFAHLLALLALAPLSTTWVHIVVTPPSPRSFSSRIPNIRKVYAATWLPIVLFWAASYASFILAALLADLIGLKFPEDPDNYRLDASRFAQILCVGGVFIGLQLLLCVSTGTALTRVQASLLPADEDTVVPFDRSFAGQVEPEVVTGKGFATFKAAITTVTVRSWVRICMLNFKLMAVVVAVYMMMGVVLGLQGLVIMKMCQPEEDGTYKCHFG
ncbi:hypothetical protein N0V88_002889 [Collariella sp. IMI 366227]|nr:hypothetical protein N0V88_002889 [Collariella sp. IMI 366227]